MHRITQGRLIHAAIEDEAARRALRDALRGGQGRTAEDVHDSAQIIAYCLVAAVGCAIGLVIGGLIW